MNRKTEKHVLTFHTKKISSSAIPCKSSLHSGKTSNSVGIPSHYLRFRKSFSEESLFPLPNCLNPQWDLFKNWQMSKNWLSPFLYPDPENMLNTMNVINIWCKWLANILRIIVVQICWCFWCGSYVWLFCGNTQSTFLQESISEIVNKKWLYENHHITLFCLLSTRTLSLETIRRHNKLTAEWLWHRKVFY